MVHAEQGRFKALGLDRYCGLCMVEMEGENNGCGRNMGLQRATDPWRAARVTAGTWAAATSASPLLTTSACATSTLGGPCPLSPAPYMPPGRCRRRAYALDYLCER